ncbi:MAG: hypothetical protein JSU94_03205 [Phycisphaerales bacterium]|nr:MAG: hypothetical protein JSU94_03205 [Phycisphaerales bacterium]
MSVTYEAFVDPPATYRSVPFWSLNDVLEPEEIERQLELFTEGGFGGAYLHSRIGLLTEYLGPDWWKAMDAGVRACERLGIEAWFYDEDKWPSGFAGGIVPRMSEQYHSRCLLRLDRQTPVPEKAVLLKEDGKYRYVVYKVKMGNPWYNGTCWVDLLDPEMVRAFIECSYRPYADRYKSKMGAAAYGIFTDEPQFRPITDDVRHRGAMPYSPILREDFKSQHGYDLADHVGSLFEETGDYRRVRLDYYRTLSKRFEESFSRQIGQFCAGTGMVWTGHYNGEESFTSVRDNVGNMMIHYRHMQRPGMDHLGLRISGGLNGAKCLSSVANQYGMDRRLSELFGISGQNMNFEDRKWIGDWHAVLGVNHFCPHLSLYSMKGVRKRDYPPTLSPQQPYWQYNRLVEDYMARVCYMTTVGRYAPEVLVIHPLESSYIERDCHARNGDYYRVLETLQAGQRDYDLGDEQIISEIGQVRDGRFAVGRMSYGAVVLPYILTIRPSTVTLLEEFAAAGGPILIVGEGPKYVDGRQEPGRIAKLKSISRTVSREALGGALSEALPPAVRIEGDNSQFVWVHQRAVQGGRIIQLANMSRLDKVNCRVHLKPAGDNPVLWDPADGRCWKLTKGPAGGLAIGLHEAQSVILSTGEASKQAKITGTYSPAPPERKVLVLDGRWRGKRKSANAITLDFARYSTDGGKAFSEPEPVIGIHERFTHKGYSGALTLVFEAPVEKVPSNCSLVLEQPGMYRKILVNGQAVRFTGDGFYRDRSFRMTDISSLVKEGDNRIMLELDYVAPVPASYDARTRYGTEIETIYLVGDFGVKAVVADEPPAPTQRNQRGTLPKRPIHRFSRFVITGETQTFDGDLTVQGYPFFNGAFELQRTFEIKRVEPQRKYYLKFPGIEAIVVTAELNGESLGAAAWSPWEIEITPAVRAGNNRLTLTFVNSLRNLLGPLHHRDGELTSVGPESFTGVSGGWLGGGPGEADWYDVRLNGQTRIWRDDYHIIPFGLLAPVEIIAR